ncbi:splicing factor: proline- and glutamine-rich-like protein [Dinothrombium tinctorium]|uniref:Splicing factor: proline-and glutamine-rich-like protein n=1 Tax=Dinothrombium tinctorium TaxID=1965070 RepID=A0A443RMC2_9ACAR|nr:splicing factor: proline- and glutamine-rich-like protein [Dinothrombium tinctorium]
MAAINNCNNNNESETSKIESDSMSETNQNQQKNANFNNANKQVMGKNRVRDKNAKNMKGAGSKPMGSFQAPGVAGNEWAKNMPLLGAPTYDLKPKERTDEGKKFTGRCRVFVANLPNDITEDKLRKLFEVHGEVSEVFLGKGNSFAFVKMDTRKNAESARAALDFKNYDGRTLRVRLAAHAAALRVKNLSPMVTNELLEHAFSFFGEIERAIVITDDRGRSIGEGIVEFARKSSAQQALKRCSNECFLLTAIPKPVYVEPFEQRDEEEGFPEKHVNKHHQEFRQEREIGPRFAEPGTFEHEFAMRWKQLFELEKQKRERLEIEIQEARNMLQEQMEYARVEHQTKVLREQLRQMEEQSHKLVQIRNDRMTDERRRDEERQRQEMLIRQQEEDILRRQQVQDFSALRRQENELRMQANALQELLDRQEQALRQMSTGVGGNADQIFQNRLASIGDAVNSQSSTLQPPAAIQHLQALQGNLGPMMNNSMNASTPLDISRFAQQGPPNMNPGLGGPGGPGGPLGGPGVPLGGPGPNRPTQMRGGPGGGPQQQRFNRPNYNQGPQTKRRRF